MLLAAAEEDSLRSLGWALVTKPALPSSSSFLFSSQEHFWSGQWAIDSNVCLLLLVEPLSVSKLWYAGCSRSPSVFKMLGKRSVLPSLWWSLLLQELSPAKKCIDLWLLSLMGRAISCKALLWPFSNWERLENSLAAASTGLSCLTDWTRWTVSLRSSCVLPANFFSMPNDFYSTFWGAPVNLRLSSSCDLTQLPGEWSVKVQLAFSVH